MDPRNKLSEKQACFRGGFSTADHISTFISIIQKGMAHWKGKLLIAIADYIKAFDTVRQIMFVAMPKYERSVIENVKHTEKCE